MLLGRSFEIGEMKTASDYVVKVLAALSYLHNRTVWYWTWKETRLWQVMLWRLPVGIYKMKSIDHKDLCRRVLSRSQGSLNHHQSGSRRPESSNCIKWEEISMSENDASTSSFQGVEYTDLKYDIPIVKRRFERCWYRSEWSVFEALKPMSARFSSGKLTAVMGPSGSG